MTPEQFNDIIIPMRGMLKGLALRYTADADEAEDVVQEVMLRLWGMRLRLSGEGHNRALAITILRNIMTDRHRRASHELTTDVLPDVVGDDGMTPERHDMAELVAHIVDRLPELQRLVFRMKDVEGYDFADIMLVTGCSAESLRQNLSRARRRIRAELARLMTAGVKQ